MQNTDDKFTEIKCKRTFTNKRVRITDGSLSRLCDLINNQNSTFTMSSPIVTV